MIFKLGVLAVCYLNGFTHLPKQIEGEVVIQLKNYITIAVKNRAKTETVEMTFPKKKCKVK